MSNIPLPLQLAYLWLDGGNLEGTLPESWRNLTNVSLCRNSLYLLIDVHGVPSVSQFMKNFRILVVETQLHHLIIEVCLVLLDLCNGFKWVTAL